VIMMAHASQEIVSMARAMGSESPGIALVTLSVMLDSTAIGMKHLASRANVCSSLMKVSSVIQLNRNALIGLFVTTMYARLRVV